MVVFSCHTRKCLLLLVGIVIAFGLMLTACPMRGDPPLTGIVTIEIEDRYGRPLPAPEPEAVLRVNTSLLGGEGEISFQWRRGAINISPRATPDDPDRPSNPFNGFYVVEDDDAGHVITVVVSRSGNSGVIIGAPIGPIYGVPPYRIDLIPLLDHVMQGETEPFSSLFRVIVSAQDGTVGGVRQTVVWSVMDGGEWATVSEDGDSLEVADNAPIGTLIPVRATAVDPTAAGEVLYREMNVRVSAAPRAVIVTLDGHGTDNVEVARGRDDLQFLAQVTGDDDTLSIPPQRVTWYVTPGQNGTVIDPHSGLLRVGPGVENGTHLTVRATAVNGVYGVMTVTVTYAPVTGVEVIPATVSLPRFANHPFTARVSPETANQAVRWRLVSGPGFIDEYSGMLMVGTDATIGSQIIIRATTVGLTAAGIAAYGDATVTVTVDATQVIVTPPTATVEQGREQQFSAQVLPAGASQYVEWSVSSMAGGTLIDGNGLLRVGAMAPPGQLTVTARAVGTEIRGNAIVTVTLAPCPGNCGCSNRNCGRPDCDCPMAPTCLGNCGCGNRDCPMLNCPCTPLPCVCDFPGDVGHCSGCSGHQCPCTPPPCACDFPGNVGHCSGCSGHQCPCTPPPCDCNFPGNVGHCSGCSWHQCPCTPPVCACDFPGNVGHCSGCSGHQCQCISPQCTCGFPGNVGTCPGPCPGGPSCPCQPALQCTCGFPGNVGTCPGLCPGGPSCLCQPAPVCNCPLGNTGNCLPSCPGPGPYCDCDCTQLLTCPESCGCIGTCGLDDCVCPISVTVTPNPANIAWGVSSLQFGATVAPAGAPQEVDWSTTGAPSNISINPTTGLLTILAATPTVTVTSPVGNVERGRDHSFNASVAVTPPMANFTVTARTRACGSVFDTRPVTMEDPPQNVTWELVAPVPGVSINPSTGVLSVAADVPHGTMVNVRATGHGSATGDSTVTVVYAPITSITTDPMWPVNIPAGDYRLFTVHVYPLAANQAIDWTLPVLPPNVAVTVTGSTIRISTTTYPLSVSFDPSWSNLFPANPSTMELIINTPSVAAFAQPGMARAAPGSVTLTPSAATLRRGESLTFDANVQPMVAGSEHPVVWTITGTPPGVTVTRSGTTVTVTATGTATPGRVNLTATVAGTAVSDTVTVTVTGP